MQENSGKIALATCSHYVLIVWPMWISGKLLDLVDESTLPLRWLKVPGHMIVFIDGNEKIDWLAE